MTTKERLHQLIDQLPESEAGIVERMLRGLQAPAPADVHPLLRALENAPVDDEPDDDDFDGGLTEARADVAAGRLYSAEEVKRELGLA